MDLNTENSLSIAWSGGKEMGHEAALGSVGVKLKFASAKMNRSK